MLKLYNICPFLSRCIGTLIAGEGKWLRTLQPQNMRALAAIILASPMSHYERNKNMYCHPIIWFHEVINDTENVLISVFNELGIPLSCIAEAMECKNSDSQENSFLSQQNLNHIKVEAALLGDPDNEELQKLKADLEEVIALQIGDRVMAPLPNGNRAVAVVDSLTAAGVAVIFISSGQKTIVDPSDLSDAPDAGKKHYVFDSARSGISKSAANKKEWLAERERRRLRAQKKEMKRKELDLAKESEKNSWIKFNHKAVSKGIKGMKRVIATGSAQDGPAGVKYLSLQCFIMFNHEIVLLAFLT
ncbi:unnamed protein product [Angiostrongylus costaricensis]|uniref:FACT complex subunit n=1 Tax=Angiostrongylus costaricensis TaxID=334426 RepID=A0A158PD76_ANGCS|nr:unnamed protein product [Angiostrongylus costaricensis]